MCDHTLILGLWLCAVRQSREHRLVWVNDLLYAPRLASQLTVYRCRECRGIYNLYSGTIFEARQLRPAQVVLLVRGVLKGESAATLARELGMSRTTITELRHLIQQNAAHLQTETPLSDNVVEADELFQNAGEKRYGTL
jgi:hypothetical protein